MSSIPTLCGDSYQPIYQESCGDCIRSGMNNAVRWLRSQNKIVQVALTVLAAIVFSGILTALYTSNLTVSARIPLTVLVVTIYMVAAAAIAVAWRNQEKTESLTSAVQNEGAAIYDKGEAKATIEDIEYKKYLDQADIMKNWGEFIDALFPETSWAVNYFETSFTSFPLVVEKGKLQLPTAEMMQESVMRGQIHQEGIDGTIECLLIKCSCHFLDTNEISDSVIAYYPAGLKDEGSKSTTDYQPGIHRTMVVYRAEQERISGLAPIKTVERAARILRGHQAEAKWDNSKIRLSLAI
jgi:hypothetical protein